MNAEQDPHMSDPIVTRLRAALDEVATAPVPTDGASPATATRPVAAMSGRRWLAVAASLVLVGAAVTAIAVNLSHRQSVSPAGSADPTTALTMPYFLAAADLAPGPITVTPHMAGDSLVMVWARNGDMSDAMLVMHEVLLDTAGPVPVTEADSTQSVTATRTSRSFTSYGLSEQEQRELSMQVVPGSGVPYVLPVPGWPIMAMATQADGDTLQQEFGDAVTLAVGPTVVELLHSLTDADSITKVKVAGQLGWKFETSGATPVVWLDSSSGRWAMLIVPPDLADRVDALIAAVMPTSSGSNQPTESTESIAPPTPTAWTAEVALDTAVSSYALATYDAAISPDPAVGQPMPTIRLTDGTTLTVDTPTLFVFVAHWEAHGDDLALTLQKAVDDGSLDGTHVVMVFTAAETTDSELIRSWLSGHGWAGDVLYDTSSGDRSPGIMAGYFGIPGYPPYYVMVDADGRVGGRLAGEQSLDDLVALARTAS